MKKSFVSSVERTLGNCTFSGSTEKLLISILVIFVTKGEFDHDCLQRDFYNYFRRFTMRHWLRDHIKAVHPTQQLLANIPGLTMTLINGPSTKKNLPDLIKIHQEAVFEEVDEDAYFEEEVVVDMDLELEDGDLGECVIEEEVIDEDYMAGMEEEIEVEEEEEEEEIAEPWETMEEDGEGFLEDDDEKEFSDSSSIFSLLSQELLEPQVQIEEMQESMVVS